MESLFLQLSTKSMMFVMSENLSWGMEQHPAFQRNAYNIYLHRISVFYAAAAHCWSLCGSSIYGLLVGLTSLFVWVA